MVTGGFHSSALQGLLNGAETTAGPPGTAAASDAVTRLSLTPYSYERLDGLKGYESGMPNPGFYHQVWEDGPLGVAQTHRRLAGTGGERLAEARPADQRGRPDRRRDDGSRFAALRGHAVVCAATWSTASRGAGQGLNLGRGQPHPLLDAVHEVFRGGERGRLAEGTAACRSSTTSSDGSPRTAADPTRGRGEFELDLDPRPTAHKSRLLHQIALLGIAGFARLGGTDFARRDDLVAMLGALADRLVARPGRLGDRGGAVRLDRSPRRPRHGCSRRPRGPSATPARGRPAAARRRARRPRLGRRRACKTGSPP